MSNWKNLTKETPVIGDLIVVWFKGEPDSEEVTPQEVWCECTVEGRYSVIVTKYMLTIKSLDETGTGEALVLIPQYEPTAKFIDHWNMYPTHWMIPTGP